jgi:hypothetical protein
MFDMSYLCLIAEYDNELRQQQQQAAQSQMSMGALMRAQGGLDVDSLSYEDVQNLQEYMGIAADNARRLGV